ncbi:MAG TPA: cyclic nucleotide-binding domain-containing protein, partial [Gemmatimonadales bacterium]|nr:cyclic nucleotide-binding domain-containing protein [Gemmatimonadales bacterium]
MNEDLLARLAAHRTIGTAPRAELEWLVAHGTIERFETGQYLVQKGDPVLGLYIVLAGHVSHLTDQGGTWRKVIEWREGDVTGRLPYSRMTVSPGNSIVEAATDALRIDPRDVAELPMACPHVTATLVHVMVDRARTFKSSDLQFEKMAS